MTTEDNKAIVRQFFEMIDTNSLTALDDVLSPDIAEGWRGGVNDGPFSEHHVTVTDMVAEGDQVMARIATRGFHSGEWEGIPATGQRCNQPRRCMLPSRSRQDRRRGLAI